MPNWLAKLMGSKPSSERVLALEREVQKLRLELDERNRLVASLKTESERRSSNSAAYVTEAVKAQLEQLLVDLGAPVSQLITQAYLMEVESKSVQAKDVLAVAKRLVRTLQDGGLTVEGSVGQIVSFNPNYHDPLSTGTSLKRGQSVMIRFVGIGYRGKLLRKAGVTAVEE